MKSLTKKITQTLVFALLALPAMSHASMRVDNGTQHLVKFAIYQGDVMIDKCFGMLPDQFYISKYDGTLSLTATTILRGNTYVSQRVDIDTERSGDYSAIIHARNGQQEFSLEQGEGSTVGAINLNNTLLEETQFTFQSEGRPLQSIVVPGGTQRTLSLARQYKIVVVVDGVTLDPVVTANPNASFRVVSSVDRDGNEVFAVQ
ncbi:hypothetical protein QJS83_14675 [Bdellovibrio sp. 22V]|uniref:hypothetical protein n=1 Tax=Bdellovibrio sp. 22V TaxID=3044166 RepID=UPI0025430911|nr:hypothetical protein [Bdellovibrio sp. 22V]WII71711.1 hypothetical protein QJS83_14675 [Bdellovibrio sp. 22V]